MVISMGDAPDLCWLVRRQTSPALVRWFYSLIKRLDEVFQMPTEVGILNSLAEKLYQPNTTDLSESDF